MSDVLRHVIDSITPASGAQAQRARSLVAGAGAPMLERLAASLGGAQHTPRPRAARRTIVVCAGDHGTGDPGIALGALHPTVLAACAIADGTAALAQVARASATPIVVVDAGAAEPAAMPASCVALGRGPTRDLMREPAMTIVDAALGLEAGIALAISLSDHGLDVLAIGALGVGAEVASAALLGAVVGGAPPALGDSAAEAAWVSAARLPRVSGLELLATFGGAETAVLAGLILGAASMNVPILLDSFATGSAALVAATLAPATAGYLIAAHAGAFTHTRILNHLGLVPLFEVGLGHGEGTGAAMVIPLVEQVAALAAGG